MSFELKSSLVRADTNLGGGVKYRVFHFLSGSSSKQMIGINNEFIV